MLKSFRSADGWEEDKAPEGRVAEEVLTVLWRDVCKSTNDCRSRRRDEWRAKQTRRMGIAHRTPHVAGFCMREALASSKREGGRKPVAHVWGKEAGIGAAVNGRNE